MNTDERLAEADDLWQRVYDRIDSMLADMQSLRPPLDSLDEMTPEQIGAANEKADEDELNSLRECVHDVVRDALITLIWTEPYSRFVDNPRNLCTSTEDCTHRAPSGDETTSCCTDERPIFTPEPFSVRGENGSDPKLSVATDLPSANDSGRIGTIYYDEATHENVMPPDFLGDEELRWKSYPPSCCDEAAKVTDDVSNAAPSPAGHGWHYVAGHRVVDGEDWYDVREVYSFGGYTEDGIEAISESLDGLEEVLGWMLCDIRKYPVLELDRLDATNGEEA